MSSEMDRLIRRAAGLTDPSSTRQPHSADDDLGDITPDHDQGQRNSHVRPPASRQLDDFIRRAAGITIRPGQRLDLPEIG